MFEGKTIFVAPLDWGLGHASRCVPIIRGLSKKNKVIIGTTLLTTQILSTYFPTIEKVELPSYAITYGIGKRQWLRMLTHFPRLAGVIRREHLCTAQLVKDKKVDVIISDNRYGVYNRSVFSVFICHQVSLQMPFFSALISRIHRRFLGHFSEVWIPDFEDVNKRLAGKLSDSSQLRQNHKYIGPVSALKDEPAAEMGTFDYLILLSGPEPQRSILESTLLRLLRGKKKRVALVRGSGSCAVDKSEVDFCKDLGSGAELKGLISASETVICRSGYSTLMDLYLLEKRKVILIPTPGQPEQEYLARYWEKRFGARVITQEMLGKIVL